MSPPTQIKKLEELIKGSIAGEVIEQRVEPLVGPGENYGSVLYKVDFKVKNGEKVEIYHAVAKCTPPNKFIQKLLNIQVTIRSEIAWYTTVIPTIRNFQRECGVEQAADFFQNFYGARISLDPNADIVDMDAVILTENLTPLEFKNVDRHIGFDFKISKAILRDLATFHAVPMAIKTKNKGLFDTNIEPYLPKFNSHEDSSTENDDPFQDFLEALNKIPEISPYINRIATHLKNNKPYGNKSSTKEPWGSICHNDFWINNIMIKEGDNIKTMFLDFQMPSYASIAIDVVFFLIVSVAQEVATEHMDDLIKYYWDEFLMNLRQLKMDTSLFTFEEFSKEIDKAASSGPFGRALFHTYLILQDKGHSILDSPKENSTKGESKKPERMLNNRHKEKYKWLVHEYIKRDWM